MKHQESRIQIQGDYEMTKKRSLLSHIDTHSAQISESGAQRRAPKRFKSE